MFIIIIFKFKINIKLLKINFTMIRVLMFNYVTSKILNIINEFFNVPLRYKSKLPFCFLMLLVLVLFLYLLYHQSLFIVEYFIV